MQNISHAVMAQRKEAKDSLDFFPTPPWATRALCEALPHRLGKMSCWEPAAALGHMARPLAEYFEVVQATDVHPHDPDMILCDFLAMAPQPWKFDFVITNPPFRLAQEFAIRAMDHADVGVAMLCRTVWLEGGERWTGLFRDRAPTSVFIFSERVPMHKGRVDPKGSTATSYSWFVWEKERMHADYTPSLHWFPPGTRKRLERASDYEPPERHFRLG